MTEYVYMTKDGQRRSLFGVSGFRTHRDVLLCSHPMMRRPGPGLCERPATHVVRTAIPRLLADRSVDEPLCASHAAGLSREPFDFAGDAYVAAFTVVERLEIA